jgi:succinate dehydrogenase hydrophobic anchor subunit
MNGVRQVLRDYIRNPKGFQVVSYLLLAVWLIVTLAGAIALLSVNAPLGG